MTGNDTGRKPAMAFNPDAAAAAGRLLIFGGHLSRNLPDPSTETGTVPGTIGHDRLTRFDRTARLLAEEAAALAAWLSAHARGRARDALATAHCARDGKVTLAGPGRHETFTASLDDITAATGLSRDDIDGRPFIFTVLTADGGSGSGQDQAAADTLQWFRPAAHGDPAVSAVVQGLYRAGIPGRDIARTLGTTQDAVRAMTGPHPGTEGAPSRGTRRWPGHVQQFIDAGGEIQ